MNILQVISSAYRATNEEQDDTVLWLTRAMTIAGGNFDILLTGPAVNYIVSDQEANGLQFGNWIQTKPLRLGDEVSRLVQTGIKVFVIEEDASDYGLEGVPIIGGVQAIRRENQARLFDEYDQVWKW